LLLLGVIEGAEAETGLTPEAVAPEEFSIGVSEAPRHAPITPAAKLGLIVQVYDAGSFAPATLK
jgi:hypothetical protein